MSDDDGEVSDDRGGSGDQDSGDGDEVFDGEDVGDEDDCEEDGAAGLCCCQLRSSGNGGSRLV